MSATAIDCSHERAYRLGTETVRDFGSEDPDKTMKVRDHYCPSCGMHLYQNDKDE